MKKQIIKIGDIYNSYTITGEPFLEDGNISKRKVEVTCSCGTKINAYCCNLKKLTKCKKCTGLSIRKFKPGQKVGNFLILEYYNNKLKIKCECGYEYLSTCHEIGRTKICKHCSQAKIGNKHGSYKGTENISKKAFSNIKLNALRRNVVFDLTIEYLDKLFVEQNKKCAYSNTILNIGNSKIEQTASLDRIDSSKGYIIGNVQWVHKDINRMKTDFSEEKFLHIIKNIYEYKFLT
jgi:hypothetical protein